MSEQTILQSAVAFAADGRTFSEDALTAIRLWESKRSKAIAEHPDAVLDLSDRIATRGMPGKGEISAVEVSSLIDDLMAGSAEARERQIEAWQKEHIRLIRSGASAEALEEHALSLHDPTPLCVQDPTGS